MKERKERINIPIPGIIRGIQQKRLEARRTKLLVTQDKVHEPVEDNKNQTSQ
jgi:hypothetical protein